MQPRQKVSSRKFFEAKLGLLEIESENAKIKVTASFAVTQLTGVDPDVATLIERADKLLYEAKRAGRNQINF